MHGQFFKTMKGISTLTLIICLASTCFAQPGNVEVSTFLINGSGLTDFSNSLTKEYFLSSGHCQLFLRDGLAGMRTLDSNYNALDTGIISFLV